MRHGFPTQSGPTSMVRHIPFSCPPSLDCVPGDLVYARLLNQEVIIINSEEVVRDLFERRSSNYSDRPEIIRMTNDL